MTNDQALESALRAAGHERTADGLRDKRLAEELRVAGHQQLAASLEQGHLEQRVDVRPPTAVAQQSQPHPQDEDEAWQIAASNTAWEAIKAARARAGRPIQDT